MPFLAVDPDRAVHQLAQAGADRQPEAGAAELAPDLDIALGECFEDRSLSVGRDADAGVADRDLEVDAAVPFAGHPDTDRDTALAGELEGVADQVDQDLPDPRRIPQQPPRQPGAAREIQRQRTLTGLPAQRLQGLVEQSGEIERDRLDQELAGLDLREIEQVVDDHQQAFRRSMGHFYEAALLGVLGTLKRDLGHAENAGHRRSDFVAHHCQEGSLGPFGRGGGIPRGGQFALVQDALGDVAAGQHPAPDLVLHQQRPRSHAEAAAVGEFHFPFHLVGVDRQQGAPWRRRPRQPAHPHHVSQHGAIVAHRRPVQRPQLGKAVVEVHDRAVEFEHQQALGGGLEDRPQQRGRGLQFVGGSARGTGIAGAQRQQRFTLLLEYRNRLDHRQRVAAGAGHQPFDFGQRHRTAAGHVVPVESVLQRAFDFGNRLAQQLASRVAQRTQGKIVGIDDTAVGCPHQQQDFAAGCQQQSARTGVVHDPPPALPVAGSK